MQNDYKKFKQLVNIFYNEELGILDKNDHELQEKDIGSVVIEPTIIFDKFTGNMKVEFRIGRARRYKIKDISEFYDKMINEESYSYGERPVYVRSREAFNEQSKKLLDFILKYGESIKIANPNSNTSNYNYYGSKFDTSRIIVGNSGIDELFEILKGEKVKFQIDGKNEAVEFLEENPNIEFVLTKKDEKEYIIKPNIEIFQIRIIRGKKHKYVLKRNRLYCCSKKFEDTNLKLLEVFRKQYINEVELNEKHLKDLFSIIIPKVKNAIHIQDLSREELEKYKPKELITKVYLDFNKKGYLLADLRFCYGNEEINPLDEKVKYNFPRNIIKETEHLNLFKKSGFMFEAKNLRFVLPDEDKIYKFLSEDIAKYSQRFEILTTDAFRNKQIKPTQIGNVGVRLNGRFAYNKLK